MTWTPKAIRADRLSGSSFKDLCHHLSVKNGAQQTGVVNTATSGSAVGSGSGFG